MTNKLTSHFGQSRMFELKKGLFIHEGNFEDFLKMYNLALQRSKDSFPFRNDAGELYKIETPFVSFVLKTFQEHNHNFLVGSANKYKKYEEKLTGEELKKAKEEFTEDFNTRQKILDSKVKLYDTDGQVINKENLEIDFTSQQDPVKKQRREMLKKEIKKSEKKKK